MKTKMKLRLAISLWFLAGITLGIGFALTIEGTSLPLFGVGAFLLLSITGSIFYVAATPG